jgi:hypothetical protein
MTTQVKIYHDTTNVGQLFAEAQAPKIKGQNDRILFIVKNYGKKGITSSEIRKYYYNLYGDIRRTSIARGVNYWIKQGAIYRNGELRQGIGEGDNMQFVMFAK